MKKFMPFLVGLSLIVFGLIIYTTLFSKQTRLSLATLTFIDTNKTIYVFVPLDYNSMHKGLSVMTSLKEDQGMYFKFDHADKHKFYMKDMKFDLDFIFIYKDHIVDFRPNISHLNQDYIIGDVIYDSVLEVNKGFIESNKLRIGDRVLLNDLMYENDLSQS